MKGGLDTMSCYRCGVPLDIRAHVCDRIFCDLYDGAFNAHACAACCCLFRDRTRVTAGVTPP